MLAANSPVIALKLRICSVIEQLFDVCNEVRLTLLLSDLKPSSDTDTDVYVSARVCPGRLDWE